MSTLSKDNKTYAEPQRKPQQGVEMDVQSGDNQGLSDIAEANSESVQELISEGQAFEAAAVDAVENAPDADVAEVTTREVSEDDVPGEYIDRDPDTPLEE